MCGQRAPSMKGGPMSTDPTEPPRPLPDRPNLRHLKDEAKDRVRAGTATSITEAQFQTARRSGFPSWPRLRAYVESGADRRQPMPAIDGDDRAGVNRGTRALQLPV